MNDNQHCINPEHLPSESWNDSMEDKFLAAFERISHGVFDSNPASLEDIGRYYHLYSVKKGFYDKNGGPPSIPSVLGHIHSEVSEAWKEWYKSGDDHVLLGESFSMELADIIIMTCLLAAQCNINLDYFVLQKTKKNHARTGYCHGKREAPKGND